MMRCIRSLSTLCVIQVSLILTAGLGRVKSQGSEVNGADSDVYHVPVWSADEVARSSFQVGDLAEVLSTTGILSISTGDDLNFARMRYNALQGLCDCLEDSDFVYQVQGADSSLLKDGTHRSTIATATIGSTPLPLPEMDGCPTQALEDLRDQVAYASHAFVSALDRFVVDAPQAQQDVPSPLLETSSGVKFGSVSSIINSSHNLEHFHVYEKGNDDGYGTLVLDLHTDAGLFLAFVPGMHCDSNNQEDSNNDLFVQHDDTLKRAVFAPHTVGIMMGIGAERWLRTRTSLRATRHAVRMASQTRRAWYGMMHLVPQDAIIIDFPRRTFADMRKTMAVSGSKQTEYGDHTAEDFSQDDAVSIGCSTADAASLSGGALSPRINRRRLVMVNDASACNNSTNFFCWTSCLEIPEAERASSFINEGYSLYCVDPTVLASTGNSLSRATEGCNRGSLLGGAHNAACVGAWAPTFPGIPAQEVLVDEDALSTSSMPFCYGGTSMYMDGFHWTDSTCVIYLFPSWILDTAGSLVGAAIGTIFFGVALEGVIWQRRLSIARAPEGWQRVGISTMFYGLQLTLGYMLMLVVMTYSGPLFMCVILGLMSGHVAFNSGRTCTKKSKEGDEKSTFDGGWCTESAEDELVSEGITPCCQNTLK